MVSIKDVARVAGVSNKTVSRVVNKEPNVRPQTIDRVEQVIQQLGYVPNLSARLIRTKRSSTFGVMTDLVTTTPYSGDIMRGVLDWVKENDRTLLTINTDGNPEQEQLAWRTFQEHRIDGVLYVTMYHKEVELRQTVLPTVLVNCQVASTKGLLTPSIVPDDYQGAFDLTRFVLEQGHQRIAYIRLNPELLGAQLRYQAFLDATLGRDDLTIDIRIGMVGPVGREDNRVFAEVTDLITQKSPPEVIICGNDEMALQAFQAVMIRGLRIPEDISIVGFDDFQTISTRLHPPLTTAALPYHALGYQGAMLLESLVKGELSSIKPILLPCPLIRRESTISAFT
jgi:LacI family transcriptional regulator